MTETSEHLAKEEVVMNGLLAYQNIDARADWSRDEKNAARSSVRTLMMLMGVYSDFVSALPPFRASEPDQVQR